MADDIMIIVVSYIGLVSVTQLCSRRRVYSVTYVKGTWNYIRIIPSNTRANLSLFDKRTGFFYMPYTTHRTNLFKSHPKDAAVMDKCHDWDSNQRCLIFSV